MKKIITFLLLLIFNAVIFAHETKYCGFDEVMEQIEQVNPGFKSSADHILNIAKIYGSTNRNNDIIYQIPTVFHIVYNSEAQNLPDYVIESQIDVLNANFRRFNENASETREEFLPFAADAQIEFFLATEDPNGNPSSGITRTYTSASGFPYISIWDIFTGNITLDNVKSSSTGGVDAWDTSKYLNIWVCNIEDSFLGQVLGFAYPPTNVNEVLENVDLDIVPDWPSEGFTQNQDLQGVVLHYPVVGSNNPQNGDDGISGNEMGQACVHEVGHYLGLRHIWGDPIGESGCSVDDGISDTPNQNEASQFTCNYNLNSCTDSPTNYPDMVENYMDYSNDACMNMFTTNQSIVMRSVIELARPGLIEGQDEGNNCTNGDVNSDGIINVQDVILVVNIILGENLDINCSDYNADGIINIQDVILIVSEILD